MYRGRQRGLSTGTVMLAVMLLVVLGFTLAGLSTTQLRLTNRANLDIKASNLARSVAALAIAKILENPDFGETAGPNDNVELQTEAGRGWVSFHDQTPQTTDFARSTNNLDGTGSAPGGFGEPVPSGSAHIVARGESGGVTRTIEVVLRVPAFPWAVAAEGTVETRRGVLIGALPEGVWPPPPPEELLPADLLANSDEPEAVILGSDSTILGDVETPGDVKLSGNVSTINVEGEIRSGTKRVDLPTLHASDYDPAQTGTAFDDLNSFVDTGQRAVFTGAGRRQGDLTISSGLEMDGSHLFVDGNLTVRGGLSGHGILVCTGNVDIESGLTLDGATEVAVVADGRVEIKGGGKASSTVRGVFYAGGGLEAEEITLVGTLLAGEATSGVSSGISLENVSFYAEEPRSVPISGIQPKQFYLGLYDPNRPGSYRQEVGIINNTVPAGFRPLSTLSIQPGANGGFPIMATFNGSSGSQQLVIRGENELDSLGLESVAFLTSNIPQGEDIDRLIMLTNELESYDFRGEIMGGSGGTDSTSLDLFGDISRFLPFEDRVRVISWLER